MDQVLEKNNLPLVSAYCPVNLTDPAQRKDETAKLVRWANLIKKCGGSVAVIGPNGVKRDTYNFAEARPNIIASLNDMAKAVADVGIIGVLHQHTGTCVEVHDEVYSVLEAVDTRYVKFGPDVGQLQKGGSDPVQVLKDFLSIVSHVHLKDWDGGPEMEGYCPLGRGKVNLPAVLDLLEKSNIKEYFMAELDPSRGMPYKPIEAARISKQYLIGQGYTFRS